MVPFPSAEGPKRLGFALSQPSIRDARAQAGEDTAIIRARAMLVAAWGCTTVLPIYLQRAARRQIPSLGERHAGGTVRPPASTSTEFMYTIDSVPQSRPMRAVQVFVALHLVQAAAGALELAG